MPPCHLKQEELVFCNQFYNTSGETDYPPAGSAAAGLFWIITPASFSVPALCGRCSISLSFNSPNAISLKGLFSDNLGSAASGHTLPPRQISTFDLGSGVEITDSHQEQRALAWACSENPLCRGGAVCPAPWVRIPCQIIRTFHSVKY